MNKTNADTEALRGIERNHAISLETQILGASQDSLSYVCKNIGWGCNIHVLSIKS